MTLRKASNDRTTSHTVSLAVCRRRYALLAARLGGGKERNYFLIYLQDFLPLNTFGTCYKSRSVHKNSHRYLEPLSWILHSCFIPWHVFWVKGNLFLAIKTIIDTTGVLVFAITLPYLNGFASFFFVRARKRILNITVSSEYFILWGDRLYFI